MADFTSKDRESNLYRCIDKWNETSTPTERLKILDSVMLNEWPMPGEKLVTNGK